MITNSLNEEAVAVAQGQRDAPAVSVSSGLRRAIDVLFALASADLRARYGRGSIRLVKWLFDPFAVAGVYLVLVTLVLDLPGRAPGLSIACAVVSFQIVVMTIISSMDAIRNRASILLNMGFRRELIPLSTTMTESLAFSGSIALLAMMMAIYGLTPTLAILWFPLIIAVNLIFAVAIAYPLTLVGLWYEEMRPFVVSLARTLFFLAPSLVPLSQVTGAVSDWIKLNPLTGLFEGYRDALLYGQAPAAWEILYPLGVSIALLAVCVPLFRREQSHFAKLI
jgi:lipopolysaccharide transport system permease protein